MNGTDYEKITGARKLAPTEFTFHQQLGYITLTRKLQNDEALAVAYEYTYNGRAYKVGELSDDYGNLKDDEVVSPETASPAQSGGARQQQSIMPTWDLMMKNIYNLNVSQLVRDGFQLRIIYRDDKGPVSTTHNCRRATLCAGDSCMEVLGLDRLNPVNDPQKDGNFDFVEGVTINSAHGADHLPFLCIRFSKGTARSLSG